MEVVTANHGQDGLCGGNSIRTNEEDNLTPTASSCVTTDETTDESELYQAQKSEPAVVAGKSESLGFFRRTLRSVLKMERTSSKSSYDMECASTQSSVKEGYFSENEDRSEGIDSGIASESGDGPASSRLSSCTYYTSKTHAIFWFAHKLVIILYYFCLQVALLVDITNLQQVPWVLYLASCVF